MALLSRSFLTLLVLAGGSSAAAAPAAPAKGAAAPAAAPKAASRAPAKGAKPAKGAAAKAEAEPEGTPVEQVARADGQQLAWARAATLFGEERAEFQGGDCTVRLDLGTSKLRWRVGETVVEHTDALELTCVGGKECLVEETAKGVVIASAQHLPWNGALAAASEKEALESYTSLAGLCRARAPRPAPSAEEGGSDTRAEFEQQQERETQAEEAEQEALVKRRGQAWADLAAALPTPEEQLAAAKSRYPQIVSFDPTTCAIDVALGDAKGGELRKFRVREVKVARRPDGLQLTCLKGPCMETTDVLGQKPRKTESLTLQSATRRDERIPVPVAVDMAKLWGPVASLCANAPLQPE